MKLLLLSILQLFLVLVATSQSCLQNGILFSTQEAIDNFQTNYPGCTEIEGSVYIHGADITNLTGLNILTSIGGNLTIGSVNDEYQNPNLTNLSGLNNLVSIGVSLYINNNLALSDLTGLEELTTIPEDLSILQNSVLNDVSGLNNLTTIGDDLQIKYNGSLESLSGLENLDSIGGSLEIRGNDALINLSGLSSLSTINGQLIIGNNNSLTSIAGLGNIPPGSISDMAIFSNPSLTNCELQNICDYLSNPGGMVQIVYNGPGCNSAIELSVACGITSPCLPYGQYFCQSQADIDNFSLVYPDCTELQGLLDIEGFDVSNLEGISAVSSIGSGLHITRCASLIDLTDLSNLVSVGGSIIIQDNESLQNLAGLEGLTSVPGTLDFERNPYLESLAGLENISSIESLLINDNPLLADLNGLSNLSTIEQDMALTGNPSIKDLSGLSNLTSVSGSILIDLNDGLTSLTGFDNVDANDIGALYIHHNDSLSDCAIKSICDYLINTNGYAYIDANAHDCSSEEVVINFCTVGLEQLPGIEDYKIYPNPATSFLIFRNNSPSMDHLYLTISDLNGRQLINESVDAEVNVININGIPAGIYFLKIIGNQNVYVEKVVKN